VRALLAAAALVALIAFVATIHARPQTQQKALATARVADLTTGPPTNAAPAQHHFVIPAVARPDGRSLGRIVAVDDDDDWAQRQQEEDDEQAQLQQSLAQQEMQTAEQEAEEQNELAQQEAQQAEQQGLLTEQEAAGQVP
jgi:hypothetical protein